MDMPDEARDDIFLPTGRIREDAFSASALTALSEAVRIARETHWDNLRSPHVFMGLLAVPDPGVRNWGERLQADLPRLLEQFQELFHQDSGSRDPLLRLNREFLGEGAIEPLRPPCGFDGPPASGLKLRRSF